MSSRHGSQSLLRPAADGLSSEGRDGSGNAWPHKSPAGGMAVLGAVGNASEPVGEMAAWEQAAESAPAARPDAPSPGAGRPENVAAFGASEPVGEMAAWGGRRGG